MKNEKLMAELTFLEDKEIFDTVIRRALRRAKKSILIATANLRNIRVPASESDRRASSLARLLWRMVQKGVEVRILHAAKPTRSWLEDEQALEELPEANTVRRMCTRVHFKAIIVDGEDCYIGSANVTGAGLGAKSPKRRNFEVGIWTSDPQIRSRVESKFEEIWGGAFCPYCDQPRSCTVRVLDIVRESSPESE